MDRSNKPENEENLAIAYPKLVTMYEFFRMLRGEAFLDIRPSTPDHQKDYYHMEYSLQEKLDKLKTKLDPNDERINAYIKLAQDDFLLKRNNSSPKNERISLFAKIKAYLKSIW